MTMALTVRMVIIQSQNGYVIHTYIHTYIIYGSMYEHVQMPAGQVHTLFPHSTTSAVSHDVSMYRHVQMIASQVHTLLCMHWRHSASCSTSFRHSLMNVSVYKHVRMRAGQVHTLGVDFRGSVYGHVEHGVPRGHLGQAEGADYDTDADCDRVIR
jgi:hypothetical protein